MNIPFTDYNLSFSKTKDTKQSVVTGSLLGGNRSYANNRISFSVFFDLWKSQSDIYACIREWQRYVGKGGYDFCNRIDDEAELSDSITTDLENIFGYYMPFVSLKRRIVRDLGVCDNAFVQIVQNVNGEIIGLKPIDTRTMSIVSDKYGKIFGFIQRSQVEQTWFGPEEIMHFKLESDPDNELWGLSPMTTIILEANTDIEAQKTNHAILANQGTPAVQYMLDPELPEEEKKAVVEHLKSQFAGSANAGKSAVLDGITEIHAVGLSQKDMEYLNARNLATEKICATYDVPMFLLGYTAKVNNNNGTELIQNFYEGTIRPIEQDIEAVFNKQFLARTEYAGLVEFKFKPQSYADNVIATLALQELNSGAISRRQYKIKTGQEITDIDEAQENFDKLILTSGASATLLEDVGVDPIDLNDVNDIYKQDKTEQDGSKVPKA